MGGIGRGVVALALACAAAGGAAAAEGDHPVPEPPGGHPTIDEIRAHDAKTSRRVYTLGRVAWAYPSQLAGSFGAIFTRLPVDYDCTTTCLLRGLTVHGTAGLGAGGLAIGYGSLVGETGADRTFIRHAYVGWGARAAFLRTWGSATLHPEGASYLGVETAATIAQFGLTFGAFRRLGPDRPGADWRVFGSVGWGF